MSTRRRYLSWELDEEGGRVVNEEGAWLTRKGRVVNEEGARG